MPSRDHTRRWQTYIRDRFIWAKCLHPGCDNIKDQEQIDRILTKNELQVTGAAQHTNRLRRKNRAKE